MIGDSRVPGYKDPYDINGVNKAADASWSQALNALEALGYDTTALSAMLGGYADHKSGQSTERNDMFYQQLLQSINQQNQRLYDKEVLNEQRQYDLPSNLLNRLMATGMSRDAAFQLLSGSSGGSAGAGAALVGSGANASAPGVPAPSGTAAQGWVNTGLNAVSTAASLVNLGFSIPVSMNQAQLLGTQANMSQKMLNAYNLSGTAVDIISEAVRMGAISDDDGHIYDSVQSVSSGIESLAKLGNADAIDFRASGQLQQLRKLSPIASPLLSEMYKSERAGSDWDISFTDEHMRKRSIATLNDMQTQSLAQGIEQSKAEVQNIIMDTAFKEECIKLTKEQIILAKKQGRNIDADTLLKKTEARLNQLEANLQSWQEDLTYVPGVGVKSGLELFNWSTLEKMQAGALSANELNNKGAWQKEVDIFMTDADAIISANILRHFYNQQTDESISKMTPEQKQLIGVCNAYQTGHVFDYMDRLINANTQSQGIKLLGNGVDQKYVNKDIDFQLLLKSPTW